ncbi:MAG: DUF1802 family protein [Phormidesmis sp. CAN_BIN36]|nr:DUF1802 family protein [Phormidesmis sp. CAN_BIN36]
MLEFVSLDRALCLPATDVAALLRGQLIVATPKVSVQKGWTFALYPCVDAAKTAQIKPEYHQPTLSLAIGPKYHQQILSLAQATLTAQQAETVTIEAWATCENCIMLHETGQIETLSDLTVWTKNSLKKSLQERQHLFLAFLRVYRIPESIKVPSNVVTSEKFGKFISLSVLDEQQFRKPLKVTQILPVVSDRIFAQRKQQLEEMRPPLHPELEKLHSAIAQLADPNAKILEHDLKVFLGWADSCNDQPDPDLKWISTIADVGNSSDGNLFEKLVRKSFVKLGFTNSNVNPQKSLDPEGCGGAGGLDFYCEQPYQIVGECKATKTDAVPSSTPAQLIKLGLRHLRERYDTSIKIIMAAGELNWHARDTTIGNKMNVIRPETLQKLVELKAHHPGSVNLLELKPCLENAPFGEEADDKVIQFVEQIWQRLKVRSQVINAVQELQENLNSTHPTANDIYIHYNAIFGRSPGVRLDERSAYNLLIELSSPLSGHLGRVQKEDNWHCDRFYFLRDLIVD